MGKGKKPQNEEEVLGQIFDFIFKEAKKRPDKRKPIRSTGISTSGALADGIAAVLEKPGLYVTDQALATLNDALTVEFARMNADETGDNKAKFTTTSLISFLQDPDAFMSKPKAASKKALRDYMKANFLGRVHQELQANAWAHKYNLDLDAKKAIRGNFMARDIEEKEAAKAFSTYAGMQISTSELNSRKNYIISRSCDLVGREMLGRNGWENMSEDRKLDFQEHLIQGNFEEYFKKTYHTDLDKDPKDRDPRNRFANQALERYRALMNTPVERKKNTLAEEKIGKKGLWDISTYQTLEMRNINSRIEEMQTYLRAHPNLSPDERAKVELGIEQLGQTGVLLSGNLSGETQDILRAKKAIYDKINIYKSELDAARKVGDKEREKAIRYKIGELKKGDRELNNMRFWGTIGKWDGTLASLKGTFGENGENMLSSVLDGTFYDPNTNSFALPSEGTDFEFGKGSKVKILTAKLTDENGEKIKGLNKVYNSMMTNIYYLTPKSIMKTLFVNGEGFMYLAYKRAGKSMDDLKALGLDWGLLVKGDKAHIAMLRSKGFSEAQLKGMLSFTKLGNIFSFVQRQRDSVKAWMDKHVFKKLRQKLYDSLVKRIVNKEALALLKQWLLKGGFEVLAKSLVTSLLTALGIGVTGGLGSFLAPIISALITDVLYDGAKVIIQIILVVLAGIGGLIWFGIDSGKRSYDSQAYAYTNYVPGEVVTNPNFTGTSPITGEDDDHQVGEFEAGSLPDGEKCLLGSASYRCTQGPYGSYSHANVAAVDLTGVDAFYAPAFCGNDNCVVTYSGSAYCTAGYAGGMVKFKATYGGSTYEFTLIHVNTTYGVGTKLSAGQKVARIMTQQETTSACSSGEHLHLQTRVNGTVVNPWEVLTKGSSSGGFSCNVGSCPAN